MAVTHPVTGEQLRAVGASGQAVAALDATFSAPKSVSVVWALADRELRIRIEAAHELAVDRAVRYAVGRVAMVREWVDRDTVVHTKAREVVATSWRHTTARAVEGRAPDPQLHSHVLLHGAVRSDGRMVAIDSRSWLVHRRELGAAYRTELAHELSRRGYRIERGTGRGGRYFEIAGVPRDLIDRWSSRARQVQRAIDQRLTRRKAALRETIAAGGPLADRAREQLAVIDRTGRLPTGEDRRLRISTRLAKRPLTVRDLDNRWRAEARRHDFDPAQIRVPDPLVIEPASGRRMVEALTEFDATFTDRQARAVALEQSAGVPINQALTPLARLRATNEVLWLADGRLTTRAHRGSERATVRATERIAAAHVPAIPRETVTAATDEIDRKLAQTGGRLSLEQRQATQAASGERQLTVIEGHAGTGKSTVLQAVALAHQRDGRRILVTSTAALAAQRLTDDLRAADVNATAYSTAALTRAINDGQLTLSPATTVIHDEAALASTKEQRQLIDAVQRSGGRLILVGDPKQSQPVGAGGLWKHIQATAQAHETHVTLTRNLRARDPEDRRDQQHFREGEHETALRGYDQRSRLHLAPGQREAEDRALDAAHQDRRAGRRTLVITQTSNDHLDELNARAQAIRIQDGELDPESIPLTGRPYRLHPGDQVQIRNTIQTSTDQWLPNGTEAKVERVLPNLETAVLHLPDGQELTLTRSQLEHAETRLAYVQHPFPAQGVTTDTTHLVVGEHATSEGTYVGLSRARAHTHIYASPSRPEPDHNAVAAVAETVGHTERDLPSIATPLDTMA